MVGSYEVTRQTILDDLADAVGILAVISLALAIVNLFRSCRSTAATSSGRRGEDPAEAGALQRDGAGGRGGLHARDPVLHRVVERHRSLSGEGFEVAVASGRPRPGELRRRRLSREEDQMASHDWRRAAQRAPRRPPPCAAFQVTGAGHPTRAIRTKDDEFSITWGEYGGKVRRSAAGLAGLGLEPGDTVAIMLTNRPEFHLVDAAAMHLGATPFSIYNTYARADRLPGQGRRQHEGRGHREACPRPSRSARKDRARVEHVIVVDGRGGPRSLDDVKATTASTSTPAWRPSDPDDVLTLIYTSGTTGPPKGVQITHRNLMAPAEAFDLIIRFPTEAGRVLPADGPHRRARLARLPADHPGSRSRAAPTRARSSATCPRCGRPGSSPCRASGRSSRRRSRRASRPTDEQKKQATSGRSTSGMKKVRAEQAGEEVPGEPAQEHAKADELMLSKIRERSGSTR